MACAVVCSRGLCRYVARTKVNQDLYLTIITAVMVGCAAGFFELVKRVGRTKNTSNSSRRQWYSEGSARRTGQRNSLDLDDSSSSQVELTIPVKGSGAIFKTMSTHIAHEKDNEEARRARDSATATPYFQSPSATPPLSKFDV